ncbi:MAG: 50S ribosomal protein L11 [Candidatus Micrarchaeota archaeon]|nr:50S ribosomal protein L11 [Candidatus Micrarchaeota archaeon]
MADIVIAGLIEGGKASGGPPLGPALGPLGVNINGIVAEINDKTKQFAGIKIPVKVIVDPATKSYKIEVGAPPTSALILKELGIQSGAKTKEENVGNITIEQLKKIAQAKEAKMFGNTMAARVKQIIGTCKSMGVKVEGEDPRVVIAKINKGEIKV